jgi:hypothetical protein
MESPKVLFQRGLDQMEEVHTLKAIDEGMKELK